MDCIFCAIIDGAIPSTIVYQDEQLVAIKDINPVAPLHILVIPRHHAPNAAATASADPAMLGAMVTAADQIAHEGGYSDYNLLFNTGAGAGQTVFHTHLHVIAGENLTERLIPTA